jgi:hypothetical protein
MNGKKREEIWRVHVSGACESMRRRKRQRALLLRDIKTDFALVSHVLNCASITSCNIFTIVGTNLCVPRPVEVKDIEMRWVGRGSR